MPNRRPDWHFRIPEMLETLKASNRPPILDRACFERLFRVKRRQAIRLLAKCGGYKSGKTFLVYREKVIDFLEGLVKEGKVHYALEQRLKLLESLNEARNDLAASETKIQTEPELLAQKPATLPAGIELIGPGTLRIDFQDPEDLIARVAAFLKAATKDYFGFQKLLEGEK